MNLDKFIANDKSDRIEMLAYGKYPVGFRKMNELVYSFQDYHNSPRNIRKMMKTNEFWEVLNRCYYTHLRTGDLGI